MYLSRASWDTRSDRPWAWALAVVLGPLLAGALAWGLVGAINLSSKPTTDLPLVTQAAVRAAVAAELTKSLTKDRIQRALTAVSISTPLLGQKSAAALRRLERACAQADRSAVEKACQALDAARTKWENDRQASYVIVATSLSGETASLAERLTDVVMRPHPAHRGDDSTGATPTSSNWLAVARQRLDAETAHVFADWLAARLGPEGHRLLRTHLDPRNFADTVDRSADAQAALEAAVTARVVSAISGIQGRDMLADVIQRATTARFDSYNLGADGTAWGRDVAARIGWATASLVFYFALAAVIATAIVQTLRISPGQRLAFLAVTTLLAGAGLAAANRWLPTLDGRLPLVALLTDYADLFEVRIPAWAVTLNALAVAGTVFLIAGAIAIFVVEEPVDSAPAPVPAIAPPAPGAPPPNAAVPAPAPAPADVAAMELEDRLRGLRALLNAGTILLVAAVVEITATLRWPTVFIAHAEAQTAMQTAGAAIATAVGALFSVILLSTYVPATILLKRAALRRGLAPAVITALFQNAGFADLANQQTLRLVQTLLPLAPGVISTFI